MTTLLREATLSDADCLTQLRMDFLKEDYPNLSLEEICQLSETVLSYIRANLGDSLRIFVVENDGEIVSTVFLLIEKKPANPSFPTGLTGTILNVYTKCECRGHGYASSLVDRAIQVGRAFNLSYIDLHATAAGYPIYHKLGFEDYHSPCVPMRLDLLAETKTQRGERK